MQSVNHISLALVLDMAFRRGRQWGEGGILQAGGTKYRHGTM